MLDLKQLTGDVCRIATEAGHFLKEERKNFRRESVVEKHAHDYVSYVDKESEVRIVKYNRQIKKFPTEKQNVSLKHILT